MSSGDPPPPAPLPPSCSLELTPRPPIYWHINTESRIVVAVDRFHSRGHQLSKYLGTKERFVLEKSSIPTGFFCYTNMVIVLAAKRSCERFIAGLHLTSRRPGN